MRNTAVMPVEIPVADLRPGLTVWKMGPNGKFIPDVYLADYLLSDTAPRFMIRRLQFVTGNRDSANYVSWHPIGTVMITTGNDTRKPERKSRGI